MNILQLVPKLNIGGVEKGTIEVAKALALNGHKAVVVSGGGVFEKNLAAIGARHYNLPIGAKNPLTMIYCYFRLRNIIIKENIDIVHSRSRIPALTGYFAAKRTGRVFITTAHGQYKKHLITRVMGWGKIVITANETMARYMKENFGVPLQKIRIVPRGVDLEKFSFVSIEKKTGKVFRVGMICRFTPLKGHLDFLKAMAYVSRKVNNVEIVLMGDISAAKDDYIKKIELTIRRLTIGNIVKFVDSKEDVACVMESLDVLVSANQEQEAFGRSIIEAQARGVPVVATRVGGVVENIEDGETGLVCEPMNPPDMAKKILLYAEDRRFREKIAINARKFVAENYSLERAMKLTLEAYSQVFNLKSILIFKMSSLGDIVLSVPSIRAVRKRFPKAKIKVLIDVKFREVLEKCPYIDEVITCDFTSRDAGLGFLALARRLRAEDFDISIDLQNNRKSHLLAFLSSIPERYGYDNGKLSFLINRKISLPTVKIDPMEHQACILGILGITSVDQKMELWPDEAGNVWAEKFLKDNWLKKDQKLIAISLSASRVWKTKNWPIQAMIELSEMLAKEKGIRVVLLGIKDDKDKAAEFIKKTVAKPIDAAGRTNFSQLVSLIKRCDALLTSDSAPMHIACATGIPFVALFGPTDFKRHMIPGKWRKALSKKIKCAPCYKPVCPEKMKCMTSIKPKEVFDALMEII